MALPHVPLPIAVPVGIILVLCLFLWLIYCLCRRPDVVFSPNYVSQARRQSAADSGDCPICLSKLFQTDQLPDVPCSHQFHAACIDRWLRTSHTCPLCRHELREPRPDAGDRGWLDEYLRDQP